MRLFTEGAGVHSHTEREIESKFKNTNEKRQYNWTLTFYKAYRKTGAAVLLSGMKLNLYKSKSFSK